eukprot:1195932-Prorocentrum_minimum.AAC.3
MPLVSGGVSRSPCHSFTRGNHTVVKPLVSHSAKNILENSIIPPTIRGRFRRSRTCARNDSVPHDDKGLLGSDPARRSSRERISPEREPNAHDKREYSRSASQPRAPIENIPGARANRARREGIFTEREPTARAEREYPRSASQPCASSKNIPGARANRARRLLFLPL